MRTTSGGAAARESLIAKQHHLAGPNHDHVLHLMAFTEHADAMAFRKRFWQATSQNRAAIVGSNRVLRGGSWNNNAQNCRSVNRNSDAPGNRNNDFGF